MAKIDMKKVHWVLDLLTNDEFSSDEELADWFVTEGGMDKEFAKELVKHRTFGDMRKDKEMEEFVYDNADRIGESKMTKVRELLSLIEIDQYFDTLAEVARHLTNKYGVDFVTLDEPVDYGKTVKFDENGVYISVYRMDSGRYEVTDYVYNKKELNKVKEYNKGLMGEAGEGGAGVGGSAGGGGGVGTGAPGVNALGKIPMGPLRKKVKVKYNGKYKQFTEYKSSVMDDIETYLKEQGFNYDRPFKGEGIHDRIWVNQGDREFILSPERVSYFDSLDDVFKMLKKELKTIKSIKNEAKNKFFDVVYGVQMNIGNTEVDPEIEDYIEMNDGQIEIYPDNSNYEKGFMVVKFPSLKIAQKMVNTFSDMDGVWDVKLIKGKEDTQYNGM